MAKHVAQDNQTSVLSQVDYTDTQGYTGGYTYPDGSSYGAPRGSQAAKERAQAAPYSRDNADAYTALSSIYTQQLHRRRKRRRLAIVASIFALLIVGVGLGAWFFVHQADKNLGYADKDYAQALLDQLALQEHEKVFYMLIIGSDSRTSDSENEIAARERSDVLMLTRVDTESKLVTLVSVPRDTAWQQESGECIRINQLYRIGGAVQAIAGVEALTGVRINHVVEVHMDSLVDFIDEIGGLHYDVPMDLYYKDRQLGKSGTIYAGEQTLSGYEAIWLIRSRMQYEGYQDAVRQSNIRGVVEALYEQITAKSVGELPGVVLSAAQCVDTDLNTLQIMSILSDLGSDATFYNASGPYVGDTDPGNGLWLCYQNPDGWARLMEMVDAGEDPSSISYDDDAVYYPSTGEQVFQ